MISISLFWGYFRWIWCCNVHTCIYRHLGKIFRKPVIHVHVHVLDRPYNECTNNWRTRLIGHCNRCSYWQHAPTCRYDPDEIYVAPMQGVLAFFRILFDTSRSFVCYSVEYYIIRLWPVYTHDCVFAVIPRTVVVEHTAVVRDILEEFE